MEKRGETEKKNIPLKLCQSCQQFLKNSVICIDVDGNCACYKPDDVIVVNRHSNDKNTSRNYIKEFNRILEKDQKVFKDKVEEAAWQTWQSHFHSNDCTRDGNANSTKGLRFYTTETRCSPQSMFLIVTDDCGIHSVYHHTPGFTCSSSADGENAYHFWIWIHQDLLQEPDTMLNCCSTVPIHAVKSRELRGGVLYTDCHCLRRNGLQYDCRRSGCQTSPLCSALPRPLCEPARQACIKHSYNPHAEPLSIICNMR